MRREKSQLKRKEEKMQEVIGKHRNMFIVKAITLLITEKHKNATLDMSYRNELFGKSNFLS